MLGKLLERHLGLIYSTVDQPERWRGALSQIAIDIGAQRGLVSIKYLWARRLLLQLNLDSTETEFSKPGSDNAPVIRGRCRQTVEPVAEAPAEGRNLSRRDNCVNPSGERLASWVYLREREGLAIRLAFERSVTPGYFLPATLAHLNRLAPHVQRAAELANQLSELQLNNHLLSTDCDTGGLLLIDEAWQIIAATPRAKRWLEKHLKPLREHFGRLECSEAAVAERLREHVECVRNVGHSKSQLPSPAVEFNTRLGRVSISACPFQERHRHRSHLSRSSLVLVRISPAASSDAARVAEQAHLWGFTASERAVLALLVEGRDAAEIAALRSRSIETVRSQIKAVLKKAGCHRIPELLVAARVVELPRSPAN